MDERPFRKLVRALRCAQEQSHRRRSGTWLDRAREMEAVVDKELDRYFTTSTERQMELPFREDGPWHGG